MIKMVDQNKRHFFRRGLLRQVGEIVAGFQEGMQQADREIAFDRYFESYDSSYALTLAYPDDLLLETARQHGIETEGREKKEVVKELFEKHGGKEYGF
ncbi:hypothetical protein JY97_09400 [Alkalispirochaeta odontotermitis]|nr:hypothetical protein JY97_09400 [Alkalispirochaeta odontotermitis]